MALATVADVRRWLEDENALENELTPFLEAAEDWVKRVARKNWDATGTVTEDHFNVRQGSILQLKDENPIITKVTTFLTPSATGTELDLTSEIQLLDTGRLQLFFNPVVGARGLELASVSVRPVTHQRVEVQYTASSSVPKPVREGVAGLAASLYAGRGQDIHNLQSETIGGYTYRRGGPRGAQGASDSWPAPVKALLSPYIRPRVRSV